MKKSEYKLLLKNSPSFTKLTPNYQNRVLTAKGDLQQTYIKIYSDEANLLFEVRKEYMEANQKVIIELNFKVKKTASHSSRRSEIMRMAKDIHAAEDLLKNI